MSTMDSISVIIPCYNRSTLIGDTLENMLSQSLPPNEVIVVDDGSTDGSASVVESFGARVKLIRQSNQGPGAARNAGFRQSSGDYIQFMDSDDLASKNKLEVQFTALATSTADFAYGPWVRSLITEAGIKFLGKVLQARPLPPSKPMLEWFLSGWSLVFQNCLFKRSILEKAGVYRTDLMPSEDSEYFIRILLAGAQPVHTPECLVFYREHEVNKITSTGTSAVQRARDWTRFLDITGKQLVSHLPSMQLSTRLALAAAVENHVAYCKKLNIDALNENHPFRTPSVPLAGLAVPAFNMLQRVRRKLKQTADSNPGFETEPALDREYKLAAEIGLGNAG